MLLYQFLLEKNAIQIQKSTLSLATTIAFPVTTVYYSWVVCELEAHSAKETMKQCSL